MVCRKIILPRTERANRRCNRPDDSKLYSHFLLRADISRYGRDSIHLEVLQAWKVVGNFNEVVAGEIVNDQQVEALQI